MFEGLFQPMHLLIILAIALLIFGPGKLPQLGEGLGKSIREFKKAIEDGDNNKDRSMLEPKKEDVSRNEETRNEETK
ncbi:twin-arginine translocase TatA/TatE family subunit [Dissulfurimicrobium hydrothermale]|uniref:twin-arginine translocase TatA/TatE family subunit n=2 Tax=Deltaproteobacteria incertae sedis TaxID=45456 RepID=UPI001EDB7582|nr:twin-arginine translocase TatA/TatE family subunit [Dissulfurimicrobium hydrothermale]UKL13114.1 twin-arginine translocase TatA/TatE family subunit [Dissulfurimicrobium hydrothermale]